MDDLKLDQEISLQNVLHLYNWIRVTQLHGQNIIKWNSLDQLANKNVYLSEKTFRLSSYFPIELVLVALIRRGGSIEVIGFQLIVVGYYK